MKKQTIGLNRDIIDKYYTKPEVVNLCLKLIKKYIQIKPDDLIIEPSAGNGSFISGIKSLSNNCIFYDLEPENPEIIKQDFLTGLKNTDKERDKNRSRSRDKYKN